MKRWRYICSINLKRALHHWWAGIYSSPFSGDISSDSTHTRSIVKSTGWDCRPWLFHRTERNTWKTWNSYVSPHRSDQSPQTVDHWISSTSSTCWYPCCWGPCCCKELALISTKICGLKLTNDCNSNTEIHIPAIWVELTEFYPVIYSLWRSDTAVRTYIAVLCFPGHPLREIDHSLSAQNIHPPQTATWPLFSSFLRKYCILKKRTKSALGRQRG